MRVLKGILLLLLGVGALVSVATSARSLEGDNVYRKDFIQEYLLGKAVRHGADPYRPIPELAQQFIGNVPVPVFPHATPHPPPVALLSLPLTLFTYSQSVVAWFCFELLCIGLAAYLLVWELSTRITWVKVFLLNAVMLISMPFWQAIVTGQLMTLLLVLLIAVWVCIRRGHLTLSGVLLGSMLALKLMGWPIVLFLILTRKLRPVIAAIGAFAVWNIAASAVMGIDRVWYYYLEVGPTVSRLYRAHIFNFSIWSLGWRWFDGVGSPIVADLTAPPLVVSPFLAFLVTFALPLLLLVVGLSLAIKVRDLDGSFAILACISVVLNPVSWAHYLVMMAFPVCVVVNKLIMCGASRRLTLSAGVGLLILMAPNDWWYGQGLALVNALHPTHSSSILYRLATQLTLVPLAAVLGWLWLTWRTYRSLVSVS